MTNKAKTPPRTKKLGAEFKHTLELVRLRSPVRQLDIKPDGQNLARTSRKEAPATRKTFMGDWDELKYLYGKIVYWNYVRQDRGRARQFRDRLKDLLELLVSDHPDSIFVEECWSILYELDPEPECAIEHREREIKLILRLWKVSENTPARDYALRGYGVDALCDRLELLSVLYHDLGNLDRAIVLLVESQQLSECAGLAFEGKELLLDYLGQREPALASLLGGESQFASG